jgi:flagellar basal-body rod modification protein FlgD
MDVTSTAVTPSVPNQTTNTADGNPNGILGKDDFMKLLLVQLQYQDPTAPMDSEKILTQTSQLASMEASDNTKTALENLTASLGNSQQFSTIAAIGKTADMGSDAISLNQGSTSTFEVYFPKDAQRGTISITDANGDVVRSLNVEEQTAGIHQFTWDGNNNSDTPAAEGVYHVNADYTDADGNTLKTKLGAYPIESVKFDQGKTYLKVGSSYVALDQVSEVY